ncbi:MAG: hypothetical protein AAGA16_06600 [Cyanobacteria bacterium P01_E01_bin.35]
MDNNNFCWFNENEEEIKSVRKKTELNLEQILAEVWSQGLPNGILNIL